MAVNKYNGWTASENKGKLQLRPAEFSGDLKDDWVQVKVTHCGVCYSDAAIIDDEWGMTKFPVVCGHEVVGHISAVGKSVQTVKVGDRVGCSNLTHTCQTCELCLTGRDNLCAKVGWTAMQGGFGEYVRLHHTFVWPLPASLPSEYAAPLMCAGATVFNPFKVQNVKPTHRVGIVGIGGLGHIALQIAKAWGTEVTAFSTTKEKEAEAKKFGAHHFIATAEADASKTHKEYFDFILVTAPKAVDWSLYLSLLRRGGTLCIAGVAPTPINIKNSFDLIIKELRIVGAASASRNNYREMLDFCALHNIRPQIELMPLSKINEALDRVRENKPRYRCVLEHPK